MSFELLIYLAISISSLAISLSFFLPYYANFTREENAVQAESFVAMLNNAMNYRSSNFTAGIPEGVCNYGSMEIDGFRLNGKIEISNSVCANEGKTVRLELTAWPNNTFMLS
jgi:hypothetical protein